MEELSSRDRDRGTGRTSRALEMAVEHARSYANFRPGRKPLAFFVFKHNGEWGHMQILLKQMPGLTRISNVTKEAEFGDVLLKFFIADSSRIDSLRGYDCPVVVDHHVFESTNYEFQSLLHTLAGDRVIAA